MRNGFTTVELMIVLLIVGLAMGMTLPRFRVSPGHRVRAAAQQVARDLELARTRSLSAKRAVEMAFDLSTNSYTGYLDQNGDGVFQETAAERYALRNGDTKLLSADVMFGRGSAGALPSDSSSGAVTFASGRLTFGPSGLTTPFGTGGAIYLVNRTDPELVAAVSVTGAGSFKVWLYHGQGVWQ